MTLLDVLLNASPILTTMATNAITTTTTSADEHGNVNSSGATTLTSYTTTVLGSINVPKQIVIVQDSLSYVESMSDEQLIELENVLLEKGLEFEMQPEETITQEIPKVYSKTK